MAPVSMLGGRYRLTDRLGEGGMSVVWRGYDEVLDRSVAVKLLSARYASDAESRRRIRAEARSAARLAHPHICNVYDYGESWTEAGGHVPYIVMELLSGTTLAEELRAGPLPVRDALRVCVQVSSALATAHGGGLVHRDVKPANVMLTPAGAKVVDFGIAAVAGQPSGPNSDGGLWGTPGYVAPERLTGGSVQLASDVYGLGLLLYRALTGSLPWQTETVSQMLAAHKYVDPAPMPPIEGLPDEVVDLCRQCLAKDPRQRPTAYEAAKQLAGAGGWQVASATWGTVVVVDELPRWSSEAGAEELAGAGDDSDEPATVVVRPPAASGAARRRRRRWVAVVAGSAAAAVVATGLAGVAATGDRWERRGDLGTVAASPDLSAPGPDGVPQVAPDEVPGARTPDTGTEGAAEADEPDGAGGPDRSGGGGGGDDLTTDSVSDPDGSGSDGGGASDSGGSGSSGPDGGSGGSGSDGSGSDGSGSGGEPEPDSAEPEPEPEPEPVTQEVSTLLGTLVVQCVGSTASLVSADLLPGVGLQQSGPGLELGIELDLLLTKVSVTVACRSGEPVVGIDVG